MKDALEIIAPIEDECYLSGSGSLYPNDRIGILNTIEDEKIKAYKNYTEYSWLKLNNKFDLALKKSGYKPSPLQKKVFEIILKQISEVKGCNIDELQIKMSADDELLIIREGKRGLHYIIVGRDDKELFYGFSGKGIGNYLVIQFDGKSIFVNDIVCKFLNI